MDLSTLLKETVDDVRWASQNISFTGRWHNVTIYNLGNVQDAILDRMQSCPSWLEEGIVAFLKGTEDISRLNEECVGEGHDLLLFSYAEQHTLMRFLAHSAGISKERFEELFTKAYQKA